MEVIKSDSMIVLFHRGTGQLLVFRDEIEPVIDALMTNGTTFNNSSLEDSEFTKTLKKFDMFDAK